MGVLGGSHPAAGEPRRGRHVRMMVRASGIEPLTPTMSR